MTAAKVVFSTRRNVPIVLLGPSWFVTGGQGEFMFPADAGPNLTNRVPASDERRGGSSKKSGKFRVYNRSIEKFHSLEVAIFDTTVEPLKRLFDFLNHGSDAGLWLKPYRGVPASQAAKFFDLVYLDEENRVAWNVDHYPNPQFTVLEHEPASALLLPAHTIFASQVRLGHELSICAIEELDEMLETLSETFYEDTGAQVPGCAEQAHTDGSGTFRSGPDSNIVPAHGKPDSGVAPVEKGTSLAARIKRWFSPEPVSSARSNRQILPGLVAYHWSGGTPQPLQLGNISGSGFYLLTDERPYPGTLILMTLQRTGSGGEKLGNSIAVYSKVIRWGPDGVGFAFVVLDHEDEKKGDRAQGKAASQRALQEFLKEVL